ncbi:MAG: hypothetical protein SGJ27_28610 [Candidatus Melainabacteria bacterium]|nr:hypothetical protein [Candidatus Melainabacteria bacterium]
MRDTKTFKRNLGIALAICLLAPLAGHAGSGPSVDRAEKMVMNLRIGQGSAGFYLLESARLSRVVEADVRKALFQLREVDKSYSKSRGRPDDRFLEPAVIKLTQCQDKAKALTEELEDSSRVLRETIKEALLQGSAPPAK